MSQHEISNFMRQISNRLALEYERIRLNSRIDPGTAGDEGEENWAQLLKEWLPPNYKIVTKGQIINWEGALSPQIDILVLTPSYPPFLYNKKKYFAPGVVAAFESKLTLRKDDIRKTIENSRKIRSLYDLEGNTLYKELCSPILYGLLSHSTEMSINNVEKSLIEFDKQLVIHPRECIDLFCISDRATWVMHKEAFPDEYPKEVTTTYMKYTKEEMASNQLREENEYTLFTPVGVFLTALLSKLAWRDKSLQSIAGVFIGTDLATDCSGWLRQWPQEILSEEIQNNIEKIQKNGEIIDWDEWSSILL